MLNLLWALVETMAPVLWAAGALAVVGAAIEVAQAREGQGE